MKVTLIEAKVLIEDWRIEYNEYRPHRSLGMLTPSEFAACRRAPQHLSTAIVVALFQAPDIARTLVFHRKGRLT